MSYIGPGRIEGYSHSGHTGVTVTLLICFVKLLGSNLSRKADYRNRLFFIPFSPSRRVPALYLTSGRSASFYVFSNLCFTPLRTPQGRVDWRTEVAFKWTAESEREVVVALGAEVDDDTVAFIVGFFLYFLDSYPMRAGVYIYIYYMYIVYIYMYHLYIYICISFIYTYIHIYMYIVYIYMYQRQHIYIYIYIYISYTCSLQKTHLVSCRLTVTYGICCEDHTRDIIMLCEQNAEYE
jgi:hypothetical protein